MDSFAPEFVALYEVGPFLGKGAFSEVYEVKDKVTGAKYAVKIIKKELIQRIDQLRRMETEVTILKTMHHSNIIPLHHMIETPTYLYLIMELVKGGELFDKIVQKGNYSEREASSLIKKVVSAIEYLHQNNIAHRDLKPENLLVKEGDDTHVMISDFGLSRILGEDSRAFTACGTPYYVAPEVLSGSGYGKDVDLWSIGVITYFLLGGFPPFMGTTLKEIVEQILSHNYDFPSPYFDSISEVGRDFIRRLLVGPDKRMTAQQALQHPWIQNPENIPVVTLAIQRRPLTKIN